MKDYTRKFRGLEIVMDNIRLEEQLIPTGFDLASIEDKPLDFFKKYGFNVSSLFSELYYRYNGIKSDKYIPASLYFYYINPYLVNMNMSLAYVDKNIYSTLFPDVKQPSTIVKNINHRYYNREEVEVEEWEAIELIKNYDRAIIKPAIESGRGRGVELLRSKEINSCSLVEILHQYQSNFIVQEVVIQNETLSSLNPSSLNTCRLYTYRRAGTNEYVLLGAAVRFGGDGAYRDNACTGGGFCKICEDGWIDDTIHQYISFEKGSLKNSKGLSMVYIPNYDKVVQSCMKMHKKYHIWI